MERIILASTSPRRQALMEQIGIPFEQLDISVDENVADEVSPYDLVKIISTKKAISAMDALKSEPQDGDVYVIISADTIISQNGVVIGKPVSEQDAFDILKKLQGRHHSVYTGLTVIFKWHDGFTVKNIVDTTNVFMRSLDDNEIWDYIKTGEPFDKAGGYAIQEKGAILIEKIDGDYYTVVGLPIIKLYVALKEFGIKL